MLETPAGTPPVRGSPFGLPAQAATRGSLGVTQVIPHAFGERALLKLILPR
jgi:hypothetical protein